MKIHFPIIFCIIPLFLLSGCQSVPKDVTPAALNYNAGMLPLSIPVQISYQDEVNLLRLNKLIAEKEGFSNKERAQMFYERGLIYDRMGLIAHSRYDLNQSIISDSSFAPAYNILGIYMLLSRSYEEAFEAFDSSVELDSQMDYSYLHRAVGLYHIQRYQLAHNDIEKFYSRDTKDPYRVLWRYIINSKIDQTEALTTLKNTSHADDDNLFAWSIIDVIAGRLTEKQFLKAIANADYNNQGLAQRLCEGYFYLGQWHKLLGDNNKANYYFKLAITTNIHDFVEYKYALMELAASQLALQNN